MPRALLLLILAALAASCDGTGGAAANGEAAAGEYVGGAACSPCHAAIAESYAETGMGRSWHRLTPETAVEDFTRRNEIELPGGVRYRMTARDGRFYMKQFLLGPDGAERLADERELVWVIGSNHNSRAYAVELDGKLFQTPICWYPKAELWDLCPGFDAGNEHFRRKVTETCVFCHNARMERVETAANLYRAIPEGIDCERCHGPGGAHVAKWRADGARPRGGADSTIVNPRRLAAPERRDVCFQCHLGDSHVTERVPRAPGALLDWRPGRRLSTAMVGFTFAQGVRDAFGISAQADRLARSPCFTGSGGRLECLSCHDPHVTVYSPGRRREYREACLECHESAACPERPEVRAATPEVADDCARCHMRKAEPDDQRHTEITDHWIRADIRPRGQEAIPLVLAPVPADAAHGVPEAELDYLTGRAAYALAGNVPPAARRVLWEESARSLRRALDRGLRSADASYYLGKLAGYRGRGGESIEHFRQALQVDPDHREAAFSLGQALLARGDAAGARAAMDALLERRPDDAGAVSELGRLELSRGRAGEALRRFDRALALEPWNARLHANRAVALAELGRAGDAVAAAREAVRLDPEDPGLWQMLAGAASEAGDARESAEALSRVEALRRRAPAPGAHDGM